MVVDDVMNGIACMGGVLQMFSVARSNLRYSFSEHVDVARAAEKRTGLPSPDMSNSILQHHSTGIRLLGSFDFFAKVYRCLLPHPA
jgi:hypothetical protein